MSTDLQAAVLPRAPHRVSANVFGVPLGLAGLAQCWTAAADRDVAPAWPADVLWLVTAAVWFVVAGAYLMHHRHRGEFTRELDDPTFGPFVAVAPIVLLLLGGALARHQTIAGQVVFVAALVATLAVGGWLTGQWILSESTLSQWHPGYFLPTVGGGLIASGVSAGLGYHSLARVMLGYGAVCWIVFGSIVLTRLFTQPALPLPLRPTLAIQLAPPVIAGVAWFRINGGRLDAVAYGIAGYALLMAMVQVRLIPLYRTVPFGLGSWAFSFPYAATGAYAIQWVNIEHATGSKLWTWLLLAVVTGGGVLLVTRTVAALRADRFLPRVAPPVAASA